jgi:hypothetical protein
MLRKSALFSFVLGLLLHGVSAATAQQYQLNLTATYKSTNSAGVLVTTKMTTPTLLNDIFSDGPIARLHQLVFDVQTGEVLVVQRATGEVLGAWYLFTVDTLVEDGSGTKAEVYWTVTCPSDEGYQGTAVGSVQIVREGEQITRFKMNGKFVLRYQASNGESRVYNGVFTTGAQYVAPVSL